jgi:hypothetical protein
MVVPRTRRLHNAFTPNLEASHCWSSSSQIKTFMSPVRAAFSLDGTRLVTSDHGTKTIYEVRFPQELLSVSGGDAVFGPGGKRLASIVWGR